MKRKMFAMFLCGALAISLTACGCDNKEKKGADKKETKVETAGVANKDETEESEAIDKDSHINMALFTYIEGLDPAEGWGGWNLTRCGVGETLITVNENMEFEGQLSDQWEQIDDLTYRVHIRQGVKFSNGTELTPEIAKASLERSIELNSRGGALKVASIEVDGENLIFTTEEPFSAFIANLTEPMYCIIDTTADLSEAASKPVCTGPYMITDYVSEEKIEMAANENYWGTVPAIKTITALNIGSDTKVEAILAGDIDLAQGANNTTLGQLEGAGNIDLVTVTGTREDDITFNCMEGNPLSDVNLRQALSYATDREVIAKIAGNGYAKPLGTPFPATVGYDSEKVEGQTYDADKAADLLLEAGYQDSDGNGFVEKDGEELVITISLSSSSSPAVSEALKDMWETLGVHTEIEMLENIKDKRTEGSFDVIFGGWQTVNAGDGQYYLASRWQTGGVDNYGNYSSEAFDSVMKKLDEAFDQESRVAAFVEAQQILSDECPNLWLYANDNITLVNTDKVSNITMFPIDYYLVSPEWGTGK